MGRQLFEPRDQRDECGMAGRWMGVWFGDVGEEASGSFLSGECRGSRLKRLQTHQGTRLQGAFVTRCGCTQSWAGPGGSRGGVGG